MLVSHDHKFIFLKTRKTAGSSIELLLQPYCAAPGVKVPETEFLSSRHGIIGAITGPKERLRRETPWFRPIYYHHMPAREIADRIGRKKFAAYHKISSVRNPFDRMVSYFHFHFARRGIALSDLDFATVRKRFREFVQADHWNDDSEVVMLDGRYVIDTAIRQEKLLDDLSSLGARLGLAIDSPSLPHSKDLRALRAGRATGDYFDPDLTDIVRQRMRWVFDNFDYPETPMALNA